MKRYLFISLILISFSFALSAQNQPTAIINCVENQLYTIEENGEKVFECKIDGIQSESAAEALKDEFLIFEGVIDVQYSKSEDNITYNFTIRSFSETENNHIRKMLVSRGIENAILNGQEIRTELIYR